MKNLGGTLVEEGVRERSVQVEAADWSSMVVEKVDSVLEALMLCCSKVKSRTTLGRI